MPAPKSDKEWAGAIRKAVREYREEKDGDGKVRKVRWLNALALQLVKAAQGGDIQAMKEVGDRLDGKPNQSHDHKGSFQITPVVNVTINSDNQPHLAPEAGNGATIARH